jgi:tetratricopeptide (TPR) repeat protein/predicted aspartyl protease
MSLNHQNCIRLSLSALMLAAVAAVSPAHAENKCNLVPVAELPIDMTGLRPLMTAQINGKDAKFLLDSGAFYGLMSTSTAEEHQLKLSVWPGKIIGVGGATRAWITKVRDFALLGAVFHDVEFLVSGSEVGSAGVIGQNLLSRFDVEYDLGRGAIRLFRPEGAGCARTNLAYWVPANQGFSLMDINPSVRSNPHTIGVAYINGRKIRAMFDTGAATSLMTLPAAREIGIDVTAPGVESAGESYGIGRGTAKSYIVKVASFKIGDNEEIKNTRLRVANIRLDDGDMLLGADFFLSHRIFVSNSQHRLYLTYSGGPVFNLANTAFVAAAPSPRVAEGAEPGDLADARDGPDARGAPEARDGAGAPGEAAGYARLGAALESRREFEQALQNLNKAVELDPKEPDYLFRRARLYSETGQASLAVTDLDTVVALKPDFMDAYISRARLRLAQKKPQESIADLDMASQLAPPQGDIRFSLAELYAASANLGGAIKQWDLWINSHPVDAKFVAALSERCYMKALQNQDLASGLSDCNRAIPLANMRNPDNAVLLANRGMVRLRQGAYAKAIADFDDALKMQPKNSRALYGRGVAKIRLNKVQDGGSDIDAAVKLSPAIKDYLQTYGIGP